ncbi:SRPBCC family protein [Microvirga puerhi]|uniref:SRPBCC family protein n=1 Tax=Microvirga puerhi TaxID=2876078 RepID=A0ABS7VKM0_9HYPH|nr:SRPBCC family protein [Microvirga puerhi]MBZ6076076.1 SRPBCC family protein [Microvirga puerhi]
MIKTAAIVLAVLLVAILAFAAMRPDTFRVQRSASINAPSEKIYAFIDDFRQWQAWSPYEKLDPGMTRSLSGAQSGKGAVYQWDGSKAGSGRMEIVDGSPGSKVVIKLDFIKPFEGHNIAEFILEPSGGKTTVTWAMYGPSPFIAKLMGLFINMDTMIGKDFEAGLSNLKAVAEG